MGLSIGKNAWFQNPWPATRKRKIFDSGNLIQIFKFITKIYVFLLLLFFLFLLLFLFLFFFLAFSSRAVKISFLAFPEALSPSISISVETAIEALFVAWFSTAVLTPFLAPPHTDILILFGSWIKQFIQSGLFVMVLFMRSGSLCHLWVIISPSSRPFSLRVKQTVKKGPSAGALGLGNQSLWLQRALFFSPLLVSCNGRTDEGLAYSEKENDRTKKNPHLKNINKDCKKCKVHCVTSVTKRKKIRVMNTPSFTFHWRV